ncbi:MAG: phosphate ABC transporter permease subunit PstC [Candidatus Nucleicultricaceae bacterium]
MNSTSTYIVVTLCFLSYLLGFFRTYAFIRGEGAVNRFSPHHYALYHFSVFLMSFTLIIVLFFIGSKLGIFAKTDWLMVSLFSFAVTLIASMRLKRATPIRQRLERFMRIIIFLSSFFVVLVTTSILLSLIFETIHFFEIVPFFDFLLGTEWNPEIPLFQENLQSTHLHFGLIPLLTGTLLITCIALIIAVPTGLFIALFTSEYAHPKLRLTLKPLIEVLAGIPTIVYGFFAIIAVAPLLRTLSEWTHMSISSESALGAGIVMGFMIIPFISSLSDDALNAVPQSFRENSLALGATYAETLRHIVLPAALPNIMASILLALARAIGETMLVLMAAGLSARLTLNPLDSVTTVTVQIVHLLTGDQEFDNPKTLASFALGFTLFVITLVLNLISIVAVKKHRKKYGL